MKTQITILLILLTCCLNPLFARMVWTPGTPFHSCDATWTNQPSAVTEFLNSTQYRLKVDLTGCTTARLIANVDTAGPSGATLAVQYSTDLANWYYLDGSSGPSVSTSSTGLQVSNNITIATAARTDVYLRIIGAGGDGNTDVGYGLINIQSK